MKKMIILGLLTLMAPLTLPADSDVKIGKQNITVKDTIVQYLTAKKQDTVFKECIREATDDLKKKATIKYFL